MADPLFRVLTPVGDVAAAGDLRSAADLAAAGCDLAWLLAERAVEPHGGGPLPVAAGPADPAAGLAELADQVHAQQKAVELAQAEADDLRQRLAAAEADRDAHRADADALRGRLAQADADAQKGRPAAPADGKRK